METGRLLTLLLDRERLIVAGALARCDASTTALSEMTGLEQRRVLEIVADLRSVGIATAADDGTYALDDAGLRAAAQGAASIDIPMDPVIGFGMTEDEVAVLERFFSGRVLEEIPTQRSKRLIVLQRLALEFDVGRRYVESEVNEILGAFHRDWSALRRGMIDEGLLDREPTAGGNQYWRSGGRVL